MISNFVLPEIEARNLNDIWCQQDGATWHTAAQTMDLLRGHFEERLISRFEPVSWTPWSCDITPFDCFVWGYVKSKVYADKPATIQVLEANITRVINAIPVEMLERVKTGPSEWTPWGVLAANIWKKL